MGEQTDNVFEEEIVQVLRSRCIGFQRGQHGLISVLETLVRSRQGPPTIVYQLKSAHKPDRPPLRFRPRIDIPAPPGGR